ncbi:MAG TPA: cell division protein ZipA C-terminal FtsZ-binding domain-containing protein [Acidiferrobacter sp.]|nr:cell division protein ZipA C-terminal FtsZ-binding domain-containing protein [Acidiferrobacter sp.]
MDLQDALILLGLLVIFVVGLTAYDRGRMKRRILGFVESRFSANGNQATKPAKEVDPQWAEHRVLRPQSAAASTPQENEGSEEEPFGSIDFIVFLPGDRPVIRDAALGIYKQNEYMIDKPHRLYGQRQGTQVWGNLNKDKDDVKYDLLALALQLVDQSGAVNESELNAIVQIALKLADALNRPTRFNMSFEQALDRAIALDKFCASFDVIATIHIVADSVPAFRGPAIERAAQEAHLEFGRRNIFHRKNDHQDGNRQLFSLANLYQPGSFDPLRLDALQTKGLTLFMSVPCVPDPVAVFADMSATASVLARRLGGKLVDPDRRPLTEAGLAAIKGQIQDIAERMESQGIAPGTINARRLFPL